jgi:hypothetical protein
MKKLFTTMAILTAIATPSFAQSFDPDLGTGNVLPFFPAPSLVSPAASVQPRHKIARHKTGADSFASFSGPRVSADDPALTGGGSVGYNANLYNY